MSGTWAQVVKSTGDVVDTFDTRRQARQATKEVRGTRAVWLEWTFVKGITKQATRIVRRRYAQALPSQVA